MNSRAPLPDGKAPRRRYSYDTYSDEQLRYQQPQPQRHEPTKGFPRRMYGHNAHATAPVHRASPGYDVYRERYKRGEPGPPAGSDFLRQRNEYKSYEPMITQTKNDFRDHQRTKPNQTHAYQQGLPGPPHAPRDWHEKAALLGTQAVSAYDNAASSRYKMHEKYIGYEDRRGWEGHRRRIESFRDGEQSYREQARQHEYLSRKK